MDDTVKYAMFACQVCGSRRKLVETIIDDEFVWNENEHCYEPDKFSEKFEHTGEERCAVCHKIWTGLLEKS